MDDLQKLKHLREQDWDELGAKLMNFAIRRACRYGWGLDSMLPNGDSLTGIVHTAIARTFDELDKYDEDKLLLHQLFNRVKQRLHNLAGCSDEKVKRVDDLTSVDAMDSSDFESDYDDSEYFKNLLDKLVEHPKVQNNTELELMAFAMVDGVFEPKPMSEATEIDIKRIYELRRTFQNEIFPQVASAVSGASNE